MDELSVGDPCYVEEPSLAVFGIPVGKVELAGVIESLEPRVAKVRLHGTGEMIEVDRKKVKKERLFVGDRCVVELDRKKYKVDRAKGVIQRLWGESGVEVELDQTKERVHMPRTKVKELHLKLYREETLQEGLEQALREEKGGEHQAAVEAITMTVRLGNPIEAFKVLPLDSERYVYLNMKSIREDADLANTSWYRKYRERTSQSFAEKGMKLSEVDYFASSSTLQESNWIYGGRFDLNAIREALRRMNYDQGICLGAERWNTPKGFPTQQVVVLLADTSILVSSTYEGAKRCISVIKGQASPIYDNQEIRDILTKSPGATIRASASPAARPPSRATLRKPERYERRDITYPLATGSFVEKADSETLVLTEIVMYRDDETAERHLPIVKDYIAVNLKDRNPIEVKFDCKGQFVQSTARVRVKDLSLSLFFL